MMCKATNVRLATLLSTNEDNLFIIACDQQQNKKDSSVRNMKLEIQNRTQYSRNENNGRKTSPQICVTIINIKHLNIQP